MDDDAQIISYEEYFPYGGTAFMAGKNQKEVKLKEYRYSGKERDDSTGLYYYGARYYAPWLGRWLKPDPAGTVDGLNLYAFVVGNPILFKDYLGKHTQNPSLLDRIKLRLEIWHSASVKFHDRRAKKFGSTFFYNLLSHYQFLSEGSANEDNLREDPQKIYHFYTNEDVMNKMVSSGKIKGSPGIRDEQLKKGFFPYSGNFPRGLYTGDLPPWSADWKTSSLVYGFYGLYADVLKQEGTSKSKVSHYVSFIANEEDDSWQNHGHLIEGLGHFASVDPDPKFNEKDEYIRQSEDIEIVSSGRSLIPQESSQVSSYGQLVNLPKVKEWKKNTSQKITKYSESEFVEISKGDYGEKGAKVIHQTAIGRNRKSNSN